MEFTISSHYVVLGDSTEDLSTYASHVLNSIQLETASDISMNLTAQTSGLMHFEYKSQPVESHMSQLTESGSWASTRTEEQMRTFLDNFYSEEGIVSDKIFFSGISFCIGEEELVDYFAQYGAISDFCLLRKNGKRRNCGFVTYDKSYCTQKLIEKSKHRINDTVFHITYARPEPSHRALMPEGVVVD